MAGKRKRSRDRASKMDPGQFSHLLQFNIGEIKGATHNFKESQKIGEGAFGRVFWGNLRHTEVAIKLLNREDDAIFKNEVNMLSRMRHPNIVTMIGVCPQSRAIVCEYLGNGTLESRLKDSRKPLGWKQRISILLSICRTLMFFHSMTPKAIIHGDVKPGNVILDASMKPKLIDLGLSIEVGEGSIHLDRPIGSSGYTAPEVSDDSQASIKCDTFAFGMLILRMCIDRPLDQVRQSAMHAGNLEGVLIPQAGNWSPRVRELIQLAIKCTHHEPEDRPRLGSNFIRVFYHILN